MIKTEIKKIIRELFLGGDTAFVPAGNTDLPAAGIRDSLAPVPLVALLVDHRDFRALDPARLAGKSVIDTRGVWRSECSGPGRRAHGPARPEPT